MQLLYSERYNCYQTASATQMLNFVEERKEEIDCLVVVNDLTLQPIFNHLYEKGTLLPVVVIEQMDNSQTALSGDSKEVGTDSDYPSYFYHNAEVKVPLKSLNQISTFIDQAITQFLYLAPSCFLEDKPAISYLQSKVEKTQNFLMLQQRRLSQKLKERLGYLGLYYKRHSQYFYRNLSKNEKEELITELSEEYRQIILNYFLEGPQINQDIDQFVNKAFFADLSVSQILEIHMELMDEFAQQLKLEGRSDEILVDYRLALIDIIAHLGEMYRRSIPREDITHDLLFNLD